LAIETLLGKVGSLRRRTNGCRREHPRGATQRREARSRVFPRRGLIPTRGADSRIGGRRSRGQPKEMANRSAERTGDSLARVRGDRPLMQANFVGAIESAGWAGYFRSTAKKRLSCPRALGATMQPSARQPSFS
jgi:hypothetical protein